jgi:hypothetical protein
MKKDCVRIASYTNRDGEEIIFERISPLEFKMSGFDHMYMRIGRSGERITMIDPPGGPMVMATPDMVWGGDGDIHTWGINNMMHKFCKEWNNLVIVEIELREDFAILSCLYSKELEWIEV